MIEPIGSTAVPGLAAKPVIDLLVGLEGSDDARRVIQRLIALGYQQGQSQSDEPGTLFFARVDEANEPAFHLHVAPRASMYWKDMVCFRDALRSSGELASEYETLKRRLAAAHPNDIDAYAAGKSDFVARVLGGAR